MTYTQMIFAILLPKLTELAGVVAVLTGIRVNNGRFNSIDARLTSMDTRMMKLETWMA